MKILFLISLFFFSSIGYAEPVFDGTSEETLKSSSKKITETLSEEDKEKLSTAFMTLVFVNVKEYGIPAGNKLPKEFLNVMNGKTVNEVIQLAEQQKEKAENSVQNAMEEAKERKQEKIDYIEKVKLYETSAKYYTDFLDRKNAGVRFKLKNMGDKSLSRARVTFYFKDKQGDIISEDNFGLISTIKVLKPGYISSMEKSAYLRADNVPSEWQEGSFDAKVTEVEFTN